MFSLFFPVFMVFWGMLKTQIVSIGGAKIVFSQNCRDAKNEVFDKKSHFLFLLLYVAGRQKNVIFVHTICFGQTTF